MLFSYSDDFSPSKMVRIGEEESGCKGSAYHEGKFKNGIDISLVNCENRITTADAMIKFENAVTFGEAVVHLTCAYYDSLDIEEDDDMEQIFIDGNNIAKMGIFEAGWLFACLYIAGSVLVRLTNCA